MIDHRAHQSPIVNQGNRGICAACAVTAAHEWSLGVPLSIEDAHWNGKQNDPWPNDEETSIAYILPALSVAGHAVEPTWPLNAPSWPGTPPAPSRLAENRRATPHWQLLLDPSLAEIQAELARRAVILSFAYVPDAWECGGPLVHANGGAQPITRHAVLAVGETQYDGHNTVIIRNSWGTKWGEHGFGYVTETYLEHYLVRAHILNRDGQAEAA